MTLKCKKKPEKDEKVWKEFKSDTGHAYYYNTVTNKSQWEKPKNLDEKKEKKKKTPEEERPRPPQKQPRKYTNVSAHSYLTTVYVIFLLFPSWFFGDVAFSDYFVP